LKEKILEADNARRRPVEGFDDPPKGLRESHSAQNPKQIFAIERRKRSSNIESENTSVGKISQNKLDDFSLKGEDEVDHLLATHAPSLTRGHTSTANDGEHRRDHTGDDLAVSVSKPEGASLARMPAAISSLISVDSTFLNENKTRKEEVKLIILDVMSEKVEIEGVESQAGRLMAVDPAAIKKGVNPNPRVMETRNAFTKVVIGKDVAKVTRSSDNQIRKCTPSKFQNKWLLKENRIPMLEKEVGRLLRIDGKVATVINYDKVGDFPTLGGPESEVLSKPINPNTFGLGVNRVSREIANVTCDLMVLEFVNVESELANIEYRGPNGVINESV
jgi:hypothetical protein